MEVAVQVGSGNEELMKAVLGWAGDGGRSQRQVSIAEGWSFAPQTPKLSWVSGRARREPTLST